MREMRKKFIIALIIVFVAGLVASTANADLVSHWKLDGDADDSAGVNHGTIYGSPQWTTGVVDDALSFDGLSDYIGLGDVDEFEFGNTDFSISAWFYTMGTHGPPGQQGEIICKYNWSGYGRQWRLFQSAPGNVVFYTNPTGGTGTHEYLMSLTGGYQNQWVHVAAVRSGPTKLLYINGVLDTTGSTAGVVTGKTSGAYIGAVYDPDIGMRNFFNGVIDDVRIYDTALSAEEVQQLYFSGLGLVAVDIKPGSCPNPLNLASRGLLPAAILGSQDFDVTTIDIASIRLAGVAPIRSSYEDVAAPVLDRNECECTTDGPDGYIDLTLKFKTQEIVEELINAPGGLADGQTLTLTLTGELFDATLIAGTDCVVLVGNVPKWLAAKGSDINGDGIINMLDLAELTTYWLESCEVEWQ